jgi:hypothetical protein
MMRSPSLPIGPRRRRTRSRRRSSPRRLQERWRRRAPPLLPCANRVRWMFGLPKLPQLSSVVVRMSSGSAVARQRKWWTSAGQMAAAAPRASSPAHRRTALQHDRDKEEKPASSWRVEVGPPTRGADARALGSSSRGGTSTRRRQIHGRSFSALLRACDRGSRRRETRGGVAHLLEEALHRFISRGSGGRH